MIKPRKNATPSNPGRARIQACQKNRLKTAQKPTPSNPGKTRIQACRKSIKNRQERHATNPEGHAFRRAEKTPRRRRHRSAEG
jgi:hypothetical protein